MRKRVYSPQLCRELRAVAARSELHFRRPPLRYEDALQIAMYLNHGETF